ncbi:MAG: hypothetical protein GY906_12240 [bacterium]|nr:hypothetical protein [bacterium]
MTHDYSDFVDEPVSEDSLKRLSELAEEQLQRQVEVEEAKTALKDAEERLRQVAWFDIPELMQELGMETITTLSGVKVDISQETRASIRAPKKRAAMQWLRDNGHEAIIKREVKLQFGMGEDEIAQGVVDTLGDLDYSDDSNVHSSTLKKFVKELREAGLDVPDELFSVHQQRVSKIKTK